MTHHTRLGGSISADADWLRRRNTRVKRYLAAHVEAAQSHGNGSQVFRAGTRVVLNGQQYPSIRAAAKATGIPWNRIKDAAKGATAK